MASKDKPKTSIVTHRKMLKVATEPAEPAEETTDSLQHTTAPTLKPLAKTTSKPVVKPAEKPAEKTTEKLAEEPAPQPEPPKETPSETPPETASPPAEKTADAAAIAKDKQEQLNKQNAAIQQLIDSRKYELPINSIEKRKAKHFVVLGVILAVLLVLAWGDIAADAGLIHISGIKPLTHFFSN